MRHFSFGILICLFFLIPSTSGVSAEKRIEGKKNVLILNSYHQGFKWTDDITRGTISALEPLRGETRIFIEYMGTKWVNDDPYYRELAQILKHKYSRTRFDLIISSDTDAFEFLLKYRDRVFGKIPVVFSGVNYFRESDLAGKKLFTGVSETADLRESLELALRLHPSAKKFFVINDFGISGRKVKDEIEKLEPDLRAGTEITYEKSTEIGDVLKDVESLPPDSLIFYTFFYGDPSKTSYENCDCISLIAGHSRVPVYGAWDFNLGYGIVGGKLTSGYDQGITAGRMGLRILQGETVEDIPPVLRSRTRYMFDYHQLKRFGIAKSALPQGSIVINGPDSFRKVPNDVILAAIVAMASLSGVIFMLLYVMRQRKRSEESLKKAHDVLESMVEERTRDLSVLNEKLLEDISQRRKTEEDLRNSRSLLSSIIDSNQDLIAVIDRDLRIVHSNWRGCFQNVPEEMRGEKPLCHEVFCKGQAGPCDSCPVMEVFRTGKPVFAERQIADKKFLEIRAFPICDENGNIIMVTKHMCDISDRKNMEQELIKTQKLESLGVLAGGIAHDFNNLLTGIVGNISLAKMIVDPETKLYKTLSEAEKASMRAKDLTGQLLTFSKGGAPVRKTASLAQILKESACFVLRGSNVRCKFNLPGELWTVEIDEGQMSQVFNNLIINARQSMPDGGEIDIHAENVMMGDDCSLPLHVGKYVRIFIRDKGKGIPEENLPKIFDPYFTTKENGSGLGLTTAYSIIKNHDGHIAVESRAGSGTLFLIHLPASENVEPAGSFQAKDAEPETGAGRVLVMDDEEVIREVAMEILEHLGYRVDVCGDGVDAVKQYREAMESDDPYAAVIMDLTVPGGMGGKETIRKLLEIDASVKGIVSSGYSNDTILANYADYGFGGVVSKPYLAKDLQEVLQTLLRQERREA